MPVFADFSRQAHDLGAFGNGMKMKFVANLLVAIHNVASAEAMVLGMKAGLDPAQIFKLIQSGAGNSRVFELRAPMMVEDRYDGDNLTMRVSTWQKDMKVIGEYAASVGCPTPLFSASEPIYRAALSTGMPMRTPAACARCWRRWRASSDDRALRNPRRHAHRLGSCRSRWTTASWCVRTFSARSRTANIP
jgi:3-hydroxyisobutyrate dehydrogenase-like beta-hydroxyacid dehydrogenase